MTKTSSQIADEVLYKIAMGGAGPGRLPAGRASGILEGAARGAKNISKAVGGTPSGDTIIKNRLGYHSPGPKGEGSNRVFRQAVQENAGPAPKIPSYPGSQPLKLQAEKVHRKKMDEGSDRVMRSLMDIAGK
jgi:hypothetical protein